MTFFRKQEPPLICSSIKEKGIYDASNEATGWHEAQWLTRKNADVDECGT